MRNFTKWASWKGGESIILHIKSLHELEQEFALSRKAYPGSDSVEPLLTIMWQTGQEYRRPPAQSNLAGAAAEQVNCLTKLICNSISQLSPAHEPRLEKLAELMEEEVLAKAETGIIKPSSLIEIYNEMCSEIEEQDFLSLILITTMSTFFTVPESPEQATGIPTATHAATCPACEQRPHYAHLTPDDGTKILECWLCSTQWKYPRLMCPYCANTDSDTLGYFTLEGMEACKVHYCSSCSSYHKVFDLRQYQSTNPVLFLHHLASLLCDSIAHREGFAAGSGLKWIDNS